MGNQLCPASTKEIIQDFAEIEKGQKSYQVLFKGCLIVENAKDHEVSIPPNHHFDEKDHQTYPSSQIQSSIQGKRASNDQNQLSNSHKTDPPNLHETDHNKSQPTIAQIVLPDGWRFTGQTRNGIPQGQGKQYGPNGDYFQGHYKGGIKDGLGMYKFANQNIYRGQFKQNKMWGHGTFEFANGDVFEGNFVNNVREGKGKYTPLQPNLEDLLYFQGQYQNDLKNGPGVVKYAGYEVQGYWTNGIYDFNFEEQRKLA